MSNELLPSPDILGEPLRDAERVTAEIGAAAGDRGILTEYAGGHPETQGLVDTIARLEAAVQERSRETSAAISDQLTDLVATIERIEAVLRPNGVSAPDVHFAVEHIQDIAMALRQREVEAALCDTLDAAVRDVGDAIVRNDAAAARAQSAAALLRDLTRRVTDLIALAASVEEPAAKPGERGVNVEAPKHETNRFDDTFDRPVTDCIEARVVNALMSDDDHAASFLRPALAPLPLPDNEAEAAPQEHPAIRSSRCSTRRMEQASLCRWTRWRPDSPRLTGLKRRPTRRYLCRSRASTKWRRSEYIRASRRMIRSRLCTR